MEPVNQPNDDKASTTLSVPNIAPPNYFPNLAPPPISGNIPIGFTAIVPVPLANSLDGEPLLIVRLCPNSIFNLSQNDTDRLWTHTALLPVQFPLGAYKENSNFDIICKNFPIVPQSLINSHKYVSGNVDVSIRVVSSTASTGNLIVAQADNIHRRWSFNFDDKSYLGFSSTASLKLGAHAAKSYVLSDNSLARHIVVDSTTNQAIKFYDQQKISNNLLYIGKSTTKQQLLDREKALNDVSHLFPESVLMIYAVGDLAGSTETLSLEFFFDFSKVSFHTYLGSRPFNIDFPFYQPVKALDYYFEFPVQPPPPPAAVTVAAGSVGKPDSLKDEDDSLNSIVSGLRHMAQSPLTVASPE